MSIEQQSVEVSAPEGAKRAASRSPSRSPKKARVEVDQTALKKQLEYYFSDENLRRDKFFNQRLSESGWLDFELLLSCKKVQALNADASALVAAISELPSLILNDQKTAVKREAPVPALTAVKSGHSGANQHLGGCVLAIAGIPDACNWFQVKQGIEKLPDLKVVYATNVDKATGKCAVLVLPFENDVAVLAALTEISVEHKVEAAQAAEAAEAAEAVEAVEAAEAVEVPSSLVACRLLVEAELRETVKTFPNFIVKKRELRARDAAKTKAKTMELAGYKFPNVNAVKKRVSEILKLRKAGAALVANSQDFNLVKAVLELHPAAEAKMRDFAGIKVDKAPKGDSHCFFVLRTDGSEEDFSVGKCLAAFADDQ